MICTLCFHSDPDPTYTDDGHFLDMILETLRLLVGVSVSHEVDGRTVAMTWEYISGESRDDVSVWMEKLQVGLQKIEE